MVLLIGCSSVVSEFLRADNSQLDSLREAVSFVRIRHRLKVLSGISDVCHVSDELGAQSVRSAPKTTEP